MGFFAVIFFSVISFAKMEISILSETEVTQKSEYKLFDIAVLKSGTTEDIEQLKKIKLESLDRAAILAAVKAHKENMTLVLNDKMDFKLSKSLSKEEGIRKVQNYLVSQCAECIYEVQVSQIPSNPRFDFVFSESLFRTQKGSFLVPLKSESSTALGWFSGTWKTYRKVPVLNKWLPQNSRITNEDVKDELKEVTFISDKLISTEELVGRLTNRALNAGALVTREFLVTEKAVKKGETVKVLVAEGPIEIVLSGIAETEGQIGDQIKIKTQNKMLTGKVKEKGQVVVE